MVNSWRLFLFSAITSATNLIIENNCPHRIWPGIQGSVIPLEGGFVMNSFETRNITVSDGWREGRVWVRTGCDDEMYCETGTCQFHDKPQVACNGSGPEPPVTVAEFTLNGEDGLDYYDVSLMEGFNVIMTVEPIRGTFAGEIVEQNCRKAGECVSDPNQDCYLDTKVMTAQAHPIGCHSGCQLYRTNQLCCHGVYDNAQSCAANAFVIKFKKQCPGAFVHRFDDQYFTCKGQTAGNRPDYRIVVCP